MGDELFHSFTKNFRIVSVVTTVVACIRMCSLHRTGLLVTVFLIPVLNYVQEQVSFPACYCINLSSTIHAYSLRTLSCLAKEVFGWLWVFLEHSDIRDKRLPSFYPYSWSSGRFHEQEVLSFFVFKFYISPFIYWYDDPHRTRFFNSYFSKKHRQIPWKRNQRFCRLPSRCSPYVVSFPQSLIWVIHIFPNA